MTDDAGTPQEEIEEELWVMCMAKKKHPFQGENKSRARELGFLLYAIGGHDLMCNVREGLSEAGQSDLEYVWKSIGDWGD